LRGRIPPARPARDAASHRDCAEQRKAVARLLLEGGVLMGTVIRTLAMAIGFVALTAASTPRFYSDDPIAREPESRDASTAAPHEVGLLYDMAINLFATPRTAPANVRAGNVNTIDEVPDSGWFTNRMLPRRLPVEDLVRGPQTGTPPNP